MLRLLFQYEARLRVAAERDEKRKEGLAPGQKLREIKERKQRIEASVATITAPENDTSDSEEDLSEAEQSVTAAILSTLKKKDGSALAEEAHPRRTGRTRKPKKWSD